MPIIVCRNCREQFVGAEDETICPWCRQDPVNPTRGGPSSLVLRREEAPRRRPLLISDSNHEDVSNILTLMDALPKYVELGYTTLFLEFVHPNPPTDDRELQEQIGDCSARRWMAAAYAKLVQLARKLGMRVVGLTLPFYYGGMRQRPGPAMAFRACGGFDSVAAQIIRTRSTGPDSYIVFLGAGHWRHLSQRLPALQLVGDDGKDAEVTPSVKDKQVADEWEQQILQNLMGSQSSPQTATVPTPTIQPLPIIQAPAIQAVGATQVLVRYHGKTISIQCSPSCSEELFAQLWQDKVGLPPPPDLVRAILREYARQNNILRLFR